MAKARYFSKLDRRLTPVYADETPAHVAISYRGRAPVMILEILVGVWRICKQT